MKTHYYGLFTGRYRQLLGTGDTPFAAWMNAFRSHPTAVRRLFATRFNMPVLPITAGLYSMHECCASHGERLDYVVRDNIAFLPGEGKAAVFPAAATAAEPFPQKA